MVVFMLGRSYVREFLVVLRMFKETLVALTKARRFPMYLEEERLRGVYVVLDGFVKCLKGGSPSTCSTKVFNQHFPRLLKTQGLVFCAGGYKFSVWLERLGDQASGFPLNWINESEKVCKWMRFGGFPGLSACRAIRSVENKNTSNRGTKLQQIVDQTGNDVSRRLQKDLNSLPRPLSVSDLSAIPDGGSKVRISFKGLPGSYSEDAALKAYPKCETVPCNDFEDAFKNSSGGSIHRNYDLLLRHRLQIVGEVQLDCNLCLLALPGVRAEHLKHVLSHPQALSLSDILLSKLGVSRENVDDAAGAAQYVSSNGLRDAGVVASARAAEIYGLNILAERIQKS
ncbi:arogenate dehydratase/prephenate dehydratase 1 [Quercus suber]|uniref:Arogenate dehydratase/prephenate dehydratase 1 n=1 Tax=Quercus suber TaxID=58331 RepID=A0AAW0KVY0_QUESU